MLWEIQTLSRSRVIAGNADVGQRFIKMAAQLTNFKNPSLPLSAYNPGWKAEIARMRQRIEKDRVPAGKQHLAFKTGTGGLIDAEFIAQTLCLENGWHEPNTLKALIKAEDEKALGGCDLLIDNFRKLRRIECILRRWSYVGESELPDDPAPQYRVAIRCGFATATELLEAMAEYRNAIRKVYAQYFKLPIG
jgi:glutamate-ammonia-ligase adenylyltransferase